MSVVNPTIQLEELADGAPYPITSEALIEYARQQNFDENLIKVLQELPQRTFSTSEALLNALFKPGKNG